jgi:O-antigen/teichoic acid export membrane protein
MREVAMAFFQTGTASVVVFGLTVIATKVFAMTLGPGGVGLVSLVRQTYQSALILATLNAQSAIAQGLANREPGARRAYASTVRCLLMLAGGMIAGGLLVGASAISQIVIGRQDPGMVGLIRWLSPAILIGVANIYFCGVLSGQRAVGRLALVQLAGALSAAATAYPVACFVRTGHPVALALQTVLSAAVASAVAIGLLHGAGWLPDALAWGAARLDVASARVFLRLSAVLLLSGVVATAIPLAIRAAVVHHYGLPGAGILDAAWNISMNYVLLAVGSFSTYYVPSLSRLREPRDRQALVHRVFRMSMALIVPLVVTVVVLKPAIIRFFYSGAFLAASDVMRWMLVGDYFKVTSWVFSFTMVAYADVVTVVWTEMLWGALSIGGGLFAVSVLHSLQAVGASVALVYGSYLAYTACYARSRRHFVPDRGAMLLWGLGLALILAASLHTWNDRDAHPLLAVCYIGMSACFSWRTLTVNERRGIRDAVSAVLRRARAPVPEPL